MLGFRYDELRNAYVLRLVGGRFGPVLRTQPQAHDSAAEAIGWPEELSQQEDRRTGTRRRSGRFSRDPERSAAARREHSFRD